jgi:hypothetical protein
MCRHVTALIISMAYEAVGEDPPEELEQLRNKLVADADVFNGAEGNTKRPQMARAWRSAGVLRPWHAGTDALENPGSPEGSWMG